MIKITVYTAPRCMACLATKKQLEKHGAQFTVEDIDSHPHVLEQAKHHGHTSAPYVTATDGDTLLDHWSGLRVEKIKKWARKQKENA